MGVELKNHGPENHHNGRRCRVVMVAYPLQGHINPMLQLATILHSKGLSITIVYPSQLNYPPNPSTHPEFTFLPLKAHGLMGPVAVDSLMGLTIALNKACESPFQRCMEELMVLDKGGDKIGCIIYDMYMYFAQSVADRCKIPGICLSTSSAASVLSILALGSSLQLGHNLPIQGLLMESLCEDPELQALELGNITKQLEFSKQMFDVVMAISKSKTIILNTMGFMEWAAIGKAQQYFFKLMYTIGPFNKHITNISMSNSLLCEDPTCIAWLDQHPSKSVIYVSFGSLASMTEEDLLETVMGLAQSDIPFLCVIRPDLINGGRDWAEILPQNLKERIKVMGRIVGWAPQRQILGHSSVGGFWTHCGWNSTVEGVSEGMPMICKPFFGDQFLNAKYISKVWKIGLELENELERGEVERVVRRLMVGDEGKEMRERALNLKEKVDLFFKEGESSHIYVNQLVELIMSC